RGVSLAEVAALAAQARLPYRLVFRETGQPIPIPSVVHWKVSHFAALIAEDNGRFHIQDPTFGQDLWITRTALESEASGYFLLPDETADARWRTVTAAEASQVLGMGNTGGFLQGALTLWDKFVSRIRKLCGRGMCDYDVHEMLVSLHLQD